MNKNQKPTFGNWVPVKMIWLPLIIAVVFALLGLIHSWFFILTGLFMIISIYFLIARHLFSPAGRDIQNKVFDVFMNHFECDSAQTVLDIGCGNGPLSIRIAQACPDVQITAVDYWGKNWDYSARVCEQNASVFGVEDRIKFQHASALDLPFEDGSFDVVVSNLVFHEVQDAKDKRDGLYEALRVLKPGGKFVFQDLFLLTPYFGTPEELCEALKAHGASEVEFVYTNRESFIPLWVKLPFMIGTLSLIHGVK